jgi:hypothetical protein
MAGLAPATIRQPGPEPDNSNLPDDITIEMADDEADKPQADDNGDVLSIEHGDGSVTISLDGKSLEDRPERDKGGWFENLVDDIDHLELGRISEELLRGISDDIESRKDWIESRATGIKLLGLKIEIPGLQGASDGAPVEGMSKVRHPLLLEAVLRFQANARSELLPTDGPVKVRNDDNEATLPEDNSADDLEKDLNHYLTSTATEYYPDTDRMLLMLGFGGTAFKKVYFCPLRGRPVSESVDADDLIVSDSATDMSNAKRVTHRIKMRPSTVKRMQILGVYKDIDLHTPLAANLDSVQLEKKAQAGQSPDTSNPEDRNREIYECTCELDIKGFEHKYKGRDSGLEIPYRVTIDLSSREILSVVRNYDQDSAELPVSRRTFVKYPFVPGLGFYDIGLLHILGNTTNALTAAWREMLDSGMYANFPGFLMADTGARQNTNIFRVPPGGGALVKTGGAPIRDAIMPLPYQTTGMAALMQLTDEMQQTGMRIGGTSEQQVGEGRADAPVGTTLALIDQATKVLNSVHKRLHAAQAEEFSLLAECFREHPESFWQRKGKSNRKWDEKTFLAALNNCELVPQADPNTASHSQRVMKVMGLKQLQAANPNQYDPIAVDTVALQTLGWSNPDQFFVSPEARAAEGPPPEVQKEMAKLQIEKQEADTKGAVANAKVAETKAKIEQGAFAPKPGLGAGQQTDTPVDLMDAQTRQLDAQTKAKSLGVEVHDTEIENQNRDQDRKSHEKIAALGIAKDILTNPARAEAGAKKVKPIEKKLGVKP